MNSHQLALDAPTLTPLLINSPPHRCRHVFKEGRSGFAKTIIIIIIIIDTIMMTGGKQWALSIQGAAGAEQEVSAASTHNLLLLLQ